MAAPNPARILRLKRRGEISPGFQADMTLLTREFAVVASMVRGEFVYGGKGDVR
ncbi:MAG: hypothetical protein FD137_494 [Spirochaetes bacterium]|nr:MAG: hypothetical protein FD137_494 [Spirochaetota bacterium]